LCFLSVSEEEGRKGVAKKPVWEKKRKRQSPPTLSDAERTKNAKGRERKGEAGVLAERGREIVAARC